MKVNEKKQASGKNPVLNETENQKNQDPIARENWQSSQGKDEEE